MAGRPIAIAAYSAGFMKGKELAGPGKPAKRIAVENDTAGLQTALREIFEESFLADATGPVMRSDDLEAQRRVEEDLPARTLSPGYYSRAVYLLDLASAIEAGVTFAAAALTRSEVTGLDALRRAKAAFEGDHPQCPGCGRRQDTRHNTQCPHCKTKFAGKGN